VGAVVLLLLSRSEETTHHWIGLSIFLALRLIFFGIVILPLR
jgi:hypothetical protein